MALSERGISSIPYSPEAINQELIKGKTRDELAEEFGHKTYKSIDMYMRRKGYRWDSEKQMYVVRGEKQTQKEKSGATKKVELVIKSFEEGKDPRQIAKEFGFKDHHGLSKYMKEKGYIYNPDIQNYELQADVVKSDDSNTDNQDSSTSISTDNLKQEDSEALELVMKNKDKLKELLEMADTTTTLPRYSLSGIRVPKTIQISNDLDNLIKDFTKDKGINQREFFEMAVIEFMKKYGYSGEVKGLLG